jgi:hypothetical protein
MLSPFLSVVEAGISGKGRQSVPCIVFAQARCHRARQRPLPVHGERQSREPHVRARQRLQDAEGLHLRMRHGFRQ